VPVFFARFESSPIVELRFLSPLFAALLAGCLGNTGNPVAPPSDVTKVEGDGIAGITWTPQLGITYLTFAANNPSLTTNNWTSQAVGGFAILNAGTSTVPPALVCNSQAGFVPNGLDYYFTVTAHTGTAPGGGGSPTMKATPRPAGGLLPDGTNSWKTGTAIGKAINDVVYGTITSCLSFSLPTGIYAAVGPAGAIFSSTDGINWTSRAPSGYTTNLNAVATYTSFVNNPTAPGIVFVAVGDGGAVIRSFDGVTWTPATTVNGTTSNLRSISVAGATFVAVGDGGTVQSSLDGVTWLAATSNTMVALHSVNCVGTICVAVGDAGVIDVSLDSGGTWTATTVGGGTTALRAVAYGNFDNNETGNGVIGVGGNTSINTWVAVGDSGTAFQLSGITTGVTSGWQPAPVTGAANANLIAIQYTTQFVAVDSAGHAFAIQAPGQPAPAGAWSTATVPTGITDPVAMTTNGHGFVLVGSSGDNTSSF
jgi:hypothetical protein